MLDRTPPSDPLDIFRRWFAEAEDSEPNNPNAMALASVGDTGLPSLRMVLLKDYDETGFVFYTNFESRKGTQILANPQAAGLFYWKSLGRQVRLEGPVTQVTEAEADAYFASRPRQSRIGAWASAQSRPLSGKLELERKVAEYALKYAIGEIPRPPHWSGFRIAPVRIEYWQEGAFRLHDRLVYLREGEAWRTERLYP